MKRNLYFMLPSAIVGLVILAWLIQAVLFSNVYSFIQLGQKFILTSDESSLINSKLQYTSTTTGYDGQFYYFIALDPAKAFNYIDNPAYRYSRIIFPLMSRLLSFGNLNLIPVLMLVINSTSIVGGVYLLSLLLKKAHISPYFSLIYGFYPGLYLALNYDLTEPLSFLFVLAGLFFFSTKNPAKIWLSAILFSLAVLTRETAAIFPLVYGVKFFLQRPKKNFLGSTDWFKGVIFYAVVLVPYSILKLVLLSSHWPRSLAIIPLEIIPLAGIFKLWPWHPVQLFQVFYIVVPSLLLYCLTLLFLRSKKMTVEIALLILNILFFVLLLLPDSFFDYNAAGRYNIAIVLSSLLCLPQLLKARRKFLYIYLMIVMFWFQGWQSVSFLAEYGFGTLVFLISGAVWVWVVWKR